MDTTALNASGTGSYILCELAGATYAIRSDDIEQLEIVFKDGVGYDSAKLLESARGMVGLQ